MSEQQIQPHNVTKPIQLLAAWLVGLILINGSFLGAAKVITMPYWASGLLVISSVINVPLFLILIFFLQTKFRAELQEDTYYSKHLDKITGKVKDRTLESDVFLEQLKEIQRNSSDQFDLINKSLDDVSKSLSNINSSPAETDSIVQKVYLAKSTINAMEQSRAKKVTRIAINKRVPSYLNISKSILKSGYSIADVFGKNPPEKLTISYSQGISKESLSEIYEILKPFGFDRIDCDNGEEGFEKYDIYIGSYIDEFPDERKSVLIDENIHNVLTDSSYTIDQLNDYIMLARA